MPAKPTSRMSGARRAQLRPTPRHDIQRTQIHDFNNLVQELVWATQVGEGPAVQQYCDQIRAKYLEAVSR